MQRWKRFRMRVRLVGLRPWAWTSTAPGAVASRMRSEAGQTVAEYALVLLVVAAIAVAFLLWARQSGKLDGFFDAIFDQLLNSVDTGATPQP